jgi:hypothetical protein
VSDSIRGAPPDYGLVVFIFFNSGNKTDLKAQREISTEDGQATADRFEIPFIEVSALDSTNVDLCFLKLINDIHSKTRERPPAGAMAAPAKGTLGNVPNVPITLVFPPILHFLTPVLHFFRLLFGML